MAALSVQARGRGGPGLHTVVLSGRVNTLGPALNKCHSQWGRSRPSPPARLHADNPLKIHVGQTQLWPVAQV